MKARNGHAQSLRQYVRDLPTMLGPTARDLMLCAADEIDRLETALEGPAPSQSLVVHYGKSRGALCEAPSRDLALSTSLKLVSCRKCLEWFENAGTSALREPDCKKDWSRP